MEFIFNSFAPNTKLCQYAILASNFIGFIFGDFLYSDAIKVFLHR